MNIPSNATPGTYTVKINTLATTGTPSHTLSIPLHIGDYSISGTQSVAGTPGSQVTANLLINSLFSYGGKINATCDATALSGAMCTVTPTNPISIVSGSSADLTATIKIPNSANAGVYGIKVRTQDTSGAPSHSASVSLTVGQDFLVTSSTSSQTVAAGQTSGPYALRVVPVGSSFNGSVTLACSAGLPAGAQCGFNPSTPVTPGDSAVDVVMNISTKANSAYSQALVGRRIFPAIWLPVAAIVVGLSSWTSRSPKKARWGLGGLVLCFAMMGLVSCAGVSQGGGGGGQPPPPTT
jgi:hypothetical protein